MSPAVAVEVGEVRADRVLTLASPLHTIALLVILFGGAGWMYFSTAHANAGAKPGRVALYGTTIVWEWLLTAYVLFGLRKRGKALSEATGARCHASGLLPPSDRRQTPAARGRETARAPRRPPLRRVHARFSSDWASARRGALRTLLSALE